MFYLQYFIIVLVSNFCSATNSLQQLHVIFRHGDRTPEKSLMYPTDPNKNDSLYPEGYGQLTLYGKKQEYEIGTALRKRYNEFLGDIYTTEVIDPVSTDMDRTKMSLELVLAGLYPPAPSQIWNNELLWQPIPYNYVSFSNDLMLGLPPDACPKYKTLFNKAFDADLFQNFWKNNINLIEYIRHYSGAKINTLRDLFCLYLNLHCEVQTGRMVPKWTKKVYPDFLTNATLLYYQQLTYSDEMKKLSGGVMLKKIIDDATAKIDSTLIPKKRKIFLYSGHEFNIVLVLAALNVFHPHVPPYSCYIIIEFRKIDNVYGFNILYYENPQSPPHNLTIPGCNNFCPYDKFVSILKSVIPTDLNQCND